MERRKKNDAVKGNAYVHVSPSLRAIEEQEALPRTIYGRVTNTTNWCKYK